MSHHLSDLGLLTLILAIPLSARFSLGRESLAERAEQLGKIQIKVNPTQVREVMVHPVVLES